MPKSPKPGKPKTGKFVAYYRVSTDKQGRSGLGLEAQQQAVMDWLNGGRWELLHAYREAESGRDDARPELASALAHCKRTGATLIVAKLDRLSRNVPFLRSLVDSDVDVIFCDLPQIPPGAMGRFLLTQMASVAELEAGLISERTKAALAAAKARGKKLGGYKGYTPDQAIARAALTAHANAFAADVGPIAKEMRDQGSSLRQIAAALVERGIETRQGGQWTATAVKNLLARIG